uniref:Uncharacterized protein n=1 Tax=Rhizophora mucronata TaxID=61149 RepID=A0A2P2QGX2_RHIMU
MAWFICIRALLEY